MASVQSKRIPLTSITSENSEDNITVEEFLAAQCDAIISVSIVPRSPNQDNSITVQDLQNHGSSLIAKLRAEYAEGVADVKKTLAQNCKSKFA